MHFFGIARQTALLAACAIACQAQAANVTFTDIVGTWFNANPVANITSDTGGGTNDAEIRWGGASGYNFLAAPSASAVVPPTPSADFSIGTFQHVNEPVSSSITSVSLQVVADLAVDGTSVNTVRIKHIAIFQGGFSLMPVTYEQEPRVACRRRPKCLNRTVLGPAWVRRVSSSTSATTRRPTVSIRVRMEAPTAKA